MDPRSELELQGNFLQHPFGELVAEIAESRLNGTLRVSEKERKCMVYFRSGTIVFAASNARSTRLFEMLLQRGRITREQLGKAKDFANDFEFAAFLQEHKILTKEECQRFFAQQVESIVVNLLSWTEGNWVFSSLVRIRDGLAYPVATHRLLIDYARTLPPDRMLSRFRSFEERFGRSDQPETALDLRPEEAFVLSRAADGVVTAKDLVQLASMTEAAALQLIYSLWLAGLLERHDWQRAFPEDAVAAMKGAKLELRREARVIGFGNAKRTDEKPQQKTNRFEKAAVEEQPQPDIDVETYLSRVESSVTHYDILGVETKASAETIKSAYFNLARMFHPDRYHAEGGERLRRVQNAFTMLAQAHETLKSDESRELYDYRMRKELADREKGQTQGSASLQASHASENFEHGFNLLMDKRYEEAIPFLARAVHYGPKQARYHAYYGKALSYDDKQRHKAESAMQAALRLDTNNANYRLMLAEFYIQEKLFRRAEGELTRLLALHPSNREARELLDSLKAKA